MERIGPRLMNWASILEPKTREQATLSATMPFIFPHLALMPDAHLGKGATVGSVIPTLGAIMPAAVGVDIGCGMCAVRTQFILDDIQDNNLALSVLRESIEQAIPLSVGQYNTDLRHKGTRARVEELESLPGAKQATEIAGNWHLQLGTLGSGNHFIEVSLDEEQRVWLFLHSGSRGVGNRLATRHITIAQNLARDHHVALPDRDLAYLTDGTPEFEDYIRDLRWAQQFAYLNREEMMDRVIWCFEQWIGSQVKRAETVNCHHNYTELMPGALLSQFAELPVEGRVWLSRKGAIDASAGRAGLIPGSMGTRSYVVAGKGDVMSLWSSPHGAGREYSRSAAKKTFTMDQFEESMDGIEWRRTNAFLDEIPAAYKDIDVVMDDARDLVETRHVLRQIVNVKGD